MAADEPATNVADKAKFVSLNEQALKLHKNKEFEEARRIWLQALDVATSVEDRIWAMNYIGGTYYSEQDYDNCNSWNEKILKEKGISDIAYIVTLCNIASTALTAKEYELAIKTAKEVLQDPRAMVPQWVGAWRIACSAFLSMHQFEAAFQVIDEALAEKEIIGSDREGFELMRKSAQDSYEDWKKHGRH